MELGRSSESNHFVSRKENLSNGSSCTMKDNMTLLAPHISYQE
jgi:hypothetical protein